MNEKEAVKKAKKDNEDRRRYYEPFFTSGWCRKCDSYTAWKVQRNVKYNPCSFTNAYFESGSCQKCGYRF